MKVLWVVNTLFPDPARQLGIEPPVYGGWMYGLATDLVRLQGITLAVATVSGAHLKTLTVNGIQYYMLPGQLLGRGAHNLETAWKNVVADFSPELVHIHGTEYGHGMALMKACPQLKYAVSIQGLVSVYHRYFLAGMSAWDVLGNITFRDIARWNTLFHAKHDFYKRGLIEHEYIRRADVIIGRTDWDRAHAEAINPHVDYHFCNESLRDEFYSGEKWSLDNCRRHSIFLSQASYPIKGLHQLIKAVALLRDKYPDLLVEVAGHDITKASTFKDRLKRGGYGRYVEKLIKRHSLEENVKFLGILNANDMKKAYLRSNVFICPSSIENSPNSLGEAQILGVPCIASYCGGIPSMVQDGQGALLYAFDEYEMLAAHIKLLFDSASMAADLSRKGISDATIRHERKKNSSNLVSIYIQSIKKMDRALIH